jgi:hypothetical protein
VCIDAYQAPGDAFHLDAAQQTADALVRVQHASGEWNYFIDTAGEASTRRWYETIGLNGWRLEDSTLLGQRDVRRSRHDRVRPASASLVLGLRPAGHMGISGVAYMNAMSQLIR